MWSNSVFRANLATDNPFEFPCNALKKCNNKWTFGQGLQDINEPKSYLY